MDLQQQTPTGISRWRWISAVALAIGLAALIWLFLSPQQAQRFPVIPSSGPLEANDVTLKSLHAATDGKSFPYLNQAIQALNYRLRDVEVACHDQGFDGRPVFQGACGSGFLRQNVIGNDLDYMMTIHLGDVEMVTGDDAASADALLSRMEAYLNVFHGVVRAQAAPDLALCDWRHMRYGKLRKRDFLQERLVESLRAVQANIPQHLVFTTADGRRVPSYLPAGELCLWSDLMAKFLSNRVQYAPNMFAGIREFGVVFRFYVDLVYPDQGGKARVVRNVPINPLHSYSGRVMALHNVFIGLAPAGETSADFLRTEIQLNPDRWINYRILVGADLLNQVDRHLDHNRPLKSLKRLHQSFDFLAPAFDKSFATDLGRYLMQHMRNPIVLLSEEIRELSQQAHDVVENSFLCSLFSTSGDLPKVLRQIYGDLIQLEEACPAELQRQVAAMRLDVEKVMGDRALPYRKIDRLAIEGVVDALADEAKAWTTTLLADAKEDMMLWRNDIEEELKASGVHPIRVWGLSSDRTFGVLEEDLAGVVSLDALNQLAAGTNVPPYHYALIKPADIPKDDLGETSYFPAHLWLRPAPTLIQERRYQEVLASIREDMRVFGLR